MRNQHMKEIINYIAIVLGLSFFVFWGPLAIFQIPTISFVGNAMGPWWAVFLFILGGFIPSLVGLGLTYYYEKKEGLKSLLKSAFSIKIGLDNFLSILLVFAFILLVNILITKFLKVCFNMSLFIVQASSLIPLFILGPLSEEFGWRGFLQKRLSQILNPIQSSLIIGLVWALWHLPLFYMVGTAQNVLELAFIPFLIKLILLSFIFTYFYHKSQKKLFAAILIHWIFTYVSQVLSSGQPHTILMEWLTIIPIVIGLLVVIIEDRHVFLNIRSNPE